MSDAVVPGDSNPVVVREEAVLKKYDGDLTEEEMETAEPVETLTILDGTIMKHERRGEVLFDREGGIDKRPAKFQGNPEYNPDQAPPESDKKEK